MVSLRATPKAQLLDSEIFLTAEPNADGKLGTSVVGRSTTSSTFQNVRDDEILALPDAMKDGLLFLPLQDVGTVVAFKLQAGARSWVNDAYRSKEAGSRFDSHFAWHCRPCDELWKAAVPISNSMSLQTF